MLTPVDSDDVLAWAIRQWPINCLIIPQVYDADNRNNTNNRPNCLEKLILWQNMGINGVISVNLGHFKFALFPNVSETSIVIKGDQSSRRIMVKWLGSWSRLFGFVLRLSVVRV